MTEYEVTMRMSCEAAFRVEAPTADDAEAMVRAGADGVRSMQDLDQDLQADYVISVTEVPA